MKTEFSFKILRYLLEWQINLYITSPYMSGAAFPPIFMLRLNTV